LPPFSPASSCLCPPPTNCDCTLGRNAGCRGNQSPREPTALPRISDRFLSLDQTATSHPPALDKLPDSIDCSMFPPHNMTMPRPAINMTGLRSGKLTVVTRSGQSSDGQVMWLCRCDCGRESIVRGDHLRSSIKQIKSCGCAQRRRPEPESDRFWRKVNKTSTCWLWTRGITSWGYGWFTRATRKANYAHRVAWELTHGDIPDGLVLHKCDVRSCVNPDHLYVGSQADNMRDMASRGRSTKGRKTR
jgi:hypothetical protein